MLSVSIVIPCFNEVHTLESVIDAVLASPVQNKELILVDDASTDGTREVARSYAARDSRIRLIESETNVGARTNFLRALATCQGRYLALLDGDDYWTSPNKLKRQADLLDLLTHRRLEVRGESMRIDLRAEQANSALQGLLKSLYSLGFHWVLAPRGRGYRARAKG